MIKLSAGVHQLVWEKKSKQQQTANQTENTQIKSLHLDILHFFIAIYLMYLLMNTFIEIADI